MTLSFVNLHGAPVNVADAPKKKRVARAPSAGEVEFKGWHVVGFSPMHLAEAERRHKQEIEAARRHNAEKQTMVPVPPPWDVNNYMSNAKPKRARPKPYETPEGAQACAALLERAGWLRVQLVEARRGG